MKRGLLWLGFVVVCLPMMVAVWLLVASSWSGMDGVTRHLPEGVRALVVRGILGQSSDEPPMKRALKLDPDAVESWKRENGPEGNVARSYVSTGSAEQEELYRRQAADKKSAKALAVQARSTAQAGHACDAVGLYARAQKLDDHADVFTYEEGMGRAGLVCGDLPQARGNLERVIEKEEHFLDGTEEDQLTDVRQSLQKDREFLAVVYERQQMGGMAEGSCKAAHPGWKDCGCALGGDGEVTCKQKQ